MRSMQCNVEFINARALILKHACSETRTSERTLLRKELCILSGTDVSELLTRAANLKKNALNLFLVI
jgi:hypothetical protein